MLRIVAGTPGASVTGLPSSPVTVTVAAEADEAATPHAARATATAAIRAFLLMLCAPDSP